MNAALLPLVLIGGFMLLRKVGRIRMVGVFLAEFLVFIVALGVAQGADAVFVLLAPLVHAAENGLLRRLQLAARGLDLGSHLARGVARDLRVACLQMGRPISAAVLRVCR